MTAPTLSPWEAAARQFEAPARRWATPGAMARELDSRTVQTPALDLIDRALVELADGLGQQRLAIFVAPQEGKSERASHWFPLWALTNNPDLRIAIVSHDAELAREWGAAIKRDVETFNGEEGTVDLGLRLRTDSKAQGRWKVEGRRGGVYTVSIGGSLTGRPVDLLVLDDPISNLEQAQSIKYRDRAHRFWQGVAVPRMGPQTKTILIQCMTGETPVLMGDGTERPLRDVRFGDIVATYEDGGLNTSTVRNWANQGPDFIYTIRMKSGRVVRANARHPFLVIENGEHVWRRTDRLAPGSVIQAVTGVSGEVPSARRTDAASPPSARACACRTTTSGGGPTGIGRRRLTLSAVERRTSSTGMASTQTDMPPSLLSRTGVVPSAANHPLTKTPAPTGTGSSASTTTTPPAKSEGCCATTATSSSATASLPKFSVPPLSTWKLESDEVVEVASGGFEDVFDIQVDRTENFIANGLVSHNTRWHEDDLAGRLLTTEGDRAKGGKWRVVSIPAQCEDEATDPLGRKEGEYMLSARGRTKQDWDERKKDLGPYVWAALCQQRPAPAEGGLFKRLWWRYYTRHSDRLHLGPRSYDLRDCWRFATIDLANSTRTSADFTVIAAWARTISGDLLLLDMVRAKIGGEQHFQHARPLIERWGLDTVFVEGSQYGTTLVREAANSGVPITALQAEQDKFSRALPYSAWVASGRVWLPTGAHWLDTWIGEHASFPAAQHDDTVDTGSMAVRVAITKAAPALLPPTPAVAPELDLESVPL